MFTKFINISITALAISSLACALVSAPAVAAASCNDNADIETHCRDASNKLAMNNIQSVGSHNSYKLSIPQPELELIRNYNERSAITLDYSHLTLTQQLDLGLRQLELDIVYDPEGGRFASPLLPAQTQGLANAQAFNNEQLLAPGFKVLHSQDIDVRSNCDTWIICLAEINAWSNANPLHVPILIMFNAKTGASAYPGVEAALPFDGQAFAALDAEILSVFPAHKMITPDLVRGDASTLREAVLSHGWPTLESVRGRVFFALDEGPEKVAIYSRGQNSLQGLPIFVNSVSEQADHAAYFTMNSPQQDFEKIQAAVKSGFIVRTRADANTIEARENSTSRRDAAFASGAQYISTDYYLPRLEFSDYSVSLPGGGAARCNPLLAEADCTSKLNP
ncbi:MAG: hypothetical protein ACI95C_000099 [Pseudohongiellaceae bacterium]|jgi:hypothetical protein